MCGAFEEARSVFVDERAKLIDDPDHSETEDRFVILGVSSAIRLLLVCHCYWGKGNVVRIISARKATAGVMNGEWVSVVCVTHLSRVAHRLIIARNW